MLTESKYLRNAYFLIILEDLFGGDCNTTDDKLDFDNIIYFFYHLETPWNGHNAKLPQNLPAYFQRNINEWRHCILAVEWV